MFRRRRGRCTEHRGRMNRAQKPCNKIGCTSLTRSKFCELHAGEQKAIERRYDKESRNQDHVKFYNSRAWQEARRQAIIRDHNLCQACLRSGKYTQADVVDHIVELADDYSLRITLMNLECLCHECHNKKTANERRKRSR